jgi:hypothetical protein
MLNLLIHTVLVAACASHEKSLTTVYLPAAHIHHRFSNESQEQQASQALTERSLFRSNAARRKPGSWTWGFLGDSCSTNGTYRRANEGAVEERD